MPAFAIGLLIVTLLTQYPANPPSWVTTVIANGNAALLDWQNYLNGTGSAGTLNTTNATLSASIASSPGFVASQPSAPNQQTTVSTIQGSTVSALNGFTAT